MRRAGVSSDRVCLPHSVQELYWLLLLDKGVASLLRYTNGGVRVFGCLFT